MIFRVSHQKTSLGLNRPLVSRTSTAYVVALRRDERAIRTREKVNHSGDLFHRSGSLHWNPFGHVRDLLRSQLIEDWSPDHRRRYGVDADSFGRELFA